MHYLGLWQRVNMFKNISIMFFAEISILQMFRCGLHLEKKGNVCKTIVEMFYFAYRQNRVLLHCLLLFICHHLKVRNHLFIYLTM